MEWYKGTISAGIAESKSRKCVVVVYIVGRDELSKKMNEVWETDVVSKACQSKVVALRLEANSTECAQFCEFYPVVFVPSTYLLASNGDLIEVIGGHIEPNNLAEKVTDAAKKQEQRFGQSQAPQQMESQASQQQPAAAAGDEVSESASQASSAAESEVGLSKEEKIERAKELLAKKKEEKTNEEKEKEKARELERRSLGKNVNKLKEWQKEKEQQELAKSWKKDKEEERKYREKVKADIARDRAEKQARFQQQKAETKPVVPKPVPDTKKQDEERNKFARIQFRLPDGSSLVQTFGCDNTLEDVRQYLSSEIGNRFGDYSLRTTYPPKDLLASDNNKTLKSLDLVPSAALIVLPTFKRASGVVSSSSSIFDLLSFIFSPVTWLWGIVSQFIFGSAPSNERSQPQQPAEPGPSQNERSGPQAQTRPGLRSRQQGNIHRLTAEGEDDDMALYNGNSTQQM